MSPWNARKAEEQEATAAALRELPPEQELEALRARTADLEKRISEKALEADALREVGQAIARGAFGSPFVFVDGEPFWGLDRFDQIERWLANGGF